MLAKELSQCPKDQHIAVPRLARPCSPLIGLIAGNEVAESDPKAIACRGWGGGGEEGFGRREAPLAASLTGEGPVCHDKRAGDLIAGFAELRVIGTARGTGRGQGGDDDFILLPRPSPLL